MRIVYFEPFCGISGDMMLGALLDLGIGLEPVREQLAGLGIGGYEIAAGRDSRAGIGATRAEVRMAGPQRDHRSFSDIRTLIATSSLSAWVKERATDAFHRLAVVEAKIHGEEVDHVHFHEVGAVDSIVDIVGSMIALERLLPARFLSAPVNVGQGTLECRHGRYPVPGPATQELLRGAPTYSGGIEAELTTPTGATLLATLVESYVPRPLMRIEATGYGAGARDFPGTANVLRITVGSEVAAGPEEEVAVIEATIDDMSPQIYGYFQERALARGALDVYATAIQMKKNRPGLKLTVVCAQSEVDALARLIFSETTTIGVRYTFQRRKTLERQFVEVETEYGIIRIKVSLLEGRRMNAVPEFEDCRRAAEARGVALKDVQAAASRAFLQGHPNDQETLDG
jgi:uncharacterized protein (TIGR00299 family) protein